MPISRLPGAHLLSSLLALVCVACLGSHAAAQDGHAQDAQKPKPAVEKPGDTDASRYCANVAPSIAEARIAWQTKRLNELDAQVRQRIADLEKTEAAARDWIAKREEAMKAANDGLSRSTPRCSRRTQPARSARWTTGWRQRSSAS